MKIIHMSDIHGDFETLDSALKVVKESRADVLAVTGDLSGRVYNDEERKNFLQASQAIQGLAPQIYNATDGKVWKWHDVAELVSSPERADVPDELRDLTKEYLNLECAAKKRMSQNYELFRERFKNLEQKVLLVPGNWDGEHIDDFLGQENLHNKFPGKFGGVEFAGYGGAPEHPVELPIDLTVKFNEDEAYNYFCKYPKAEVALMHTGPRGFCDTGINGGHSGQYSMLAYMNRVSPSLILTGHSHPAQPAILQDEQTGTFISNPGNLGRYENNCFGTFLEIDIDENSFVKPIKLYKICGEDNLQVYELMKRESVCA